MIQKVVRSGETLAVALPKEIIEALQLAEGSEVALHLGADRHHALLLPGNAQTGEIDPSFAQQVAKFIDQYRPALEALAK